LMGNEQPPKRGNREESHPRKTAVQKKIPKKNTI